MHPMIYHWMQQPSPSSENGKASYSCCWSLKIYVVEIKVVFCKTNNNTKAGQDPQPRVILSIFLPCLVTRGQFLHIAKSAYLAMTV